MKSPTSSRTIETLIDVSAWYCYRGVQAAESCRGVRSGHWYLIEFDSIVEELCLPPSPAPPISFLPSTVLRVSFQRDVKISENDTERHNKGTKCRRCTLHIVYIYIHEAVNRIAACYRESGVFSAQKSHKVFDHCHSWCGKVMKSLAKIARKSFVMNLSSHTSFLVTVANIAQM